MEMNNKQDDVVFRSKLPDIYIPKHLPLHSYCFQNISQYASRPCLINGRSGEIFTYDQVELTARKVAAGLSNLGIEQGDTIMLLLHNSPEYVFAFLGASYIGATSTMANPYFTPAEVIKQVRASNARLIITHACYVDKVQDYAAQHSIKITTIDDTPPNGCIPFSDLTSADEHDMPAVKIHPDDVVALPYSSGTTGLPKGVMLTHKGLVTSLAQLVDGENPNLYINSDDVLLCVLSLFHIYSLHSILLCGLRSGGAILIVPKFDIEGVLELMQKHKVTIAPFVPPIVVSMVKSAVVEKYELSCVRKVICGAAPLGKDLEDALGVILPNAKFGQGYGMTEAGVISMCLAFAKDPFEIKTGACGTVIRNAEMKIVDIQSGSSIGYNRTGEICIRGDQIMKGYLNDPDSTARTIDADGWLHTGDIGFIDGNDEVFIVDRLKEIIKYKGFQVAPAELEALLLTHPHVSDAAVVPMKNEEAGEIPVAFVVRSNGSNITEDEIKEFVSKQVIFYKRIKRVFFIQAIPKSPAGKILRKGLREELASGNWPN